MLQLDFGPSSRRAWIWRGELPEARYEPAKVQSLRVPADAQASATANQAAIEFRAIAGPRGYYGLLGAEFTPNETPELTIEVATSGRDAPGEEGAHWIRPGSARWIGEFAGLPDEYGAAVLEGAHDVPDLAPLGGGTLRFDRAAYHHVDSNYFTYAKLARIVVRLLLPDAAAMSERELADLVSEAMHQ